MSQLWDRICNLYSAARALPASERESFLSRECLGEENLKREVEILLQLKDPPEDFFTRLNAEYQQITVAAPPSCEPCCAPGETLNSRFQIVRFLGAGGMGQVFEAFDKHLDEVVALKILRPQGRHDDLLLSRFRREIRLARRITHNNVCRVFDPDRHERADGSSVHYFAMELLNGETLAARLGRPESMTEEVALHIARQMSEGLACAHEHSIVHRDFKPANVMLIDNGSSLRVAITDFGLATAVNEGPRMSTLGSTGMVLGTPGYLAPEQVFGGPATTATDIYAFGIVLHELITRIHPRAPEASRINVPGNWKAVIDRCMELNPELRFPTVRDAYAALHYGNVQGTRSFSRRRWITWSATAAGVVSLYPIFSRFYKRYANLPAGALVVVTPILNSTGDMRFDTLTTVLTTSLAQSAHFNVWNPQRLGEVLRSMRLDPNTKPDTDVWRQIAFREKASLIIFSALGRLGSGYVLALHPELIGSDPTQPARHWDRSFSPSGASAFFDAVHEAATWIREVGGEDAAKVAFHNRPPQDITSPSWEALELFAEAQQLASAGNGSEAIPILRRAVELDAQFAMGLMRLGDILNSERKSSEGYAYWRRAIDAARSQRLSEHEGLNIEARYAIEIGDYSHADVLLREWVRKFPNDPVAQQLLAFNLIDLGQYPEAVETATRTQARFGPTSLGMGAIIRALLITRRHNDVEAALATFEKIAPAPSVFQYRGIAAVVREDYSAAAAYFQKMIGTSRESSSRGRHLLAALAADKGRLDEARRLLEEGVQHDREAGGHGYASRKAVALGFLHAIDGNTRMARAWSLEAIASQPSARVLALASCTLSRSGHIADARKILNAFPNDDIPRYETARLRMRGELAEALGNAEEALELLERAAKLDSVITPKEYLAHALDLAEQPERAALIYTQIENTRFLVWDNPDTEWPGIRYLAHKHLATKQGD